jgi:hypothetical protein
MMGDTRYSAHSDALLAQPLQTAEKQCGEKLQTATSGLSSAQGMKPNSTAKIAKSAINSLCFDLMLQN